MTDIRGRTLRPPVCSCRFGCCSREEMSNRHGIPSEFEDSLARAIVDGSISVHEANVAIRSYRAEWARAPERTEVEKS